MNTPQPPENIRTPSQVDALPAPQTGEIARAVQVLLEHGTIVDAADRRIIAGSLEFLNAPTQNLPDIERHASAIGEVMCGYDMQGAVPPSEVDALNRHLQTLLCQAHMSNARTGLALVPCDPERVRYSARFAVDIATTFSKGYHDDTLLKQALALQEQVEQLK